jgi:HEAT repeat protein
VPHKQEALLKELREAGHPVTDLWDLVNTRQPYPAAVPILIRWLDTLDPAEMTRQQGEVEAAVRALAVPAARGKAAPRLIELFRSVDDPSGLGMRWAIGSTLEVVGDDSVADDLMALATDRKYGQARQMVVLGLGRLKSTRAEDVLIDLLKDEDVVGHAAMALGNRRSERAAPAISGLLQHPKPWVRQEAMKALTKIQGAGPIQRT